MTIAVYTDLQAAIAAYLTRADLTAQIPGYFISLAEATLNRVLRSTRMTNMESLSLAAGASSVALSSDFIDAIDVQGPNAPLDKVSMDKLRSLRRYRMSLPGDPLYYAILGRTLEFAPPLLTGQALELTYYQQIPALSTANTTNWLLTVAPDIYLYTSLLHAAPFLQDADRQEVMGTMVAQVVSAAVAENKQVTLTESGGGVGLAFVPGTPAQ